MDSLTALPSTRRSCSILYSAVPLKSIYWRQPREAAGAFLWAGGLPAVHRKSAERVPRRRQYRPPMSARKGLRWCARRALVLGRAHVAERRMTALLIVEYLD